jgi:hypothetical protein
MQVVYVFGKRLCPGLTEHGKFIYLMGFLKRVRAGLLDPGSLPTPDDSHKMCAIDDSEDEFECSFLDLDVNKGHGPAILKRLA